MLIVIMCSWDDFQWFQIQDQIKGGIQFGIAVDRVLEDKDYTFSNFLF